MPWVRVRGALGLLRELRLPGQPCMHLHSPDDTRWLWLQRPASPRVWCVLMANPLWSAGNPFPLEPCAHCKAPFQRRTNSNKYCTTCVPKGDLRARWLMTNYKISRPSYDEFLKIQEGLCAVCRVWEARVVDHDHACCPSVPTCGECIRGFLCAGCNLNIGNWEKGIKGCVLAPQAKLYLSMYAQ